MIVKMYNTNKYIIIKNINYYKELMRIKLNKTHKISCTKKTIQDKINFFSK